MKKSFHIRGKSEVSRDKLNRLRRIMNSCEKISNGLKNLAYEYPIVSR